MKIGVISDTHGNIAAWQKAKKIFKDVELILHAGDILAPGPKNPLTSGYAPAKLAEELNSCEIPLLIAKGNCDAEVDQLLLNIPVQSPYVFLFIEGKKILLTHGHQHNEKEKEDLAKKFKLNLYIQGHTHQPNLEKKGLTIFLNPGSPTIPIPQDIPATVAIIENNKIKILELKNKKVIKEINW